jgi:sugar O-acyltransferase (sialic acid O-acetyltransferase NeuD family)
VRVVVYGSRPDGHARVLLELFAAGRDLDVVGLIDDIATNAERCIGELSVIGSRSDLDEMAKNGIEGVLLGFGAADGRSSIVEDVEAAGLTLPLLVHTTAHVSPSATLGAGAQVLPQSSIGPGARIGRGVLINTGVIVEHDVTISDGAVIDPGAVLSGRVVIGEDVEVGSGAVVLPDVQVLAGAMVGAGAVVTREVARGDTVVGVPAHVVAPTVP